MGFFINPSVITALPTKTVELRNTVTVNTKTSKVNIGIPSFDVANDILLVIQNTLTLAKGVHYKIGTDNVSIESLEGGWDGTTDSINFHFIVLKTVVIQE